MRLGDSLVEHGVINATQLSTPLQNQKQFGGRLGANLVLRGFVNELQLARTLAQQLRISFIEESALGQLDAQIVALVTSDIALQYSCVPVGRQGQALVLAMSDPADIEKLDELRFKLGRPVRAAIATQTALHSALARFYGAVTTKIEAEFPTGTPYLGRTVEVDLPLPPSAMPAPVARRGTSYRTRLVGAATAREVADVFAGVCSSSNTCPP